MPLRAPASDRRRGFTVMEVAIGATVLAVSIVGMIQAITLGSQMMDTAEKQTVAQQIIEGEIAGLRQSPWTNATSSWNTRLAALANGTTYSITITSLPSALGTTSSTNTGLFALTNYSSGTTADDNLALMAEARGFQISLLRTNLNNDALGNSIRSKVVVTVTWTGNTGRQQTRSSEAYFTKGGLQLTYQSAR